MKGRVGRKTDLKLTSELVVQLTGDAVEFAEASHEGVTKAAEVGPIFHLLCENFTGIALACDMEDLDAAILNPFTGAVVLKFHMAYILHSGGVIPIDSGFVVVIN